ncbi:MAG TPA: phage baseplate assembly protein V [Pyrinomonadaceae bacterium]|nr:phage baseplate assembly protein V [Pyrinomonadaceae bacterium]
MATQELEEMLVNVVETMRSRYYGKYRGLVKDVDDPEKLGRIKAQVPEIYHEETSPWALPAAPFAGPGHGFVVIPEVGDGVWIEFEGGDPSRPIWTGGWWASNELPQPGDKQVRVIVTTAGHKFVLDDQNKEIHLIHSDGAEMKMTSSDFTLTIGQSEIKMTSDDISLKNGTTEIKLTSSELTLKGGPTAQLKLSASGADINNGAIKVM